MTGDPAVPRPVSPDLGRRNARLIAARTGWPAGAIEACEDLAHQYPGLTVAWMPANATEGFEREPGFYAWRSGDNPLRRGERRYEWYGATAAELGRVLATSLQEHHADRTSWNCQVCGEPWPCAPAREQLEATHDRVSLAMRMATELFDAAGVLHDEPPGALFDRFLLWTRPQRPPLPTPIRKEARHGA